MEFLFFNESARPTLSSMSYTGYKNKDITKIDNYSDADVLKGFAVGFAINRNTGAVQLVKK